MIKEFDKLIYDLSKRDRCEYIKNKNNIDYLLLNFCHNQNFVKKYHLFGLIGITV